MSNEGTVGRAREALMSGETSRRVVERYWRNMNENDWRAAGLLMHDEFVLEWPQSGERIRGRENFAAVNEHYSAAGRWRFGVRRIVADERGAVSDVTVTDGVVEARAVTFFEVRDGLIWRMTEYWPDPFEAAKWRAQWVERIE